MRSSTSMLVGLFGVLAGGAGIVLLEEGVRRADPLSFIGWWAFGMGAVLLALTFPAPDAWRAALPTVAFAALGLGLTAIALSTIGAAPTAALLLISLAVGPAVTRGLKRAMPHATHLGGLAAALLGIVALVPSTVALGAASVAVLAGLAFAGQAIVTERGIGTHPVIAFAGTTFVLAGAALIATSSALGAPLLPPTDTFMLLAASILVTGTAAYLARVRTRERLGWLAARRLLPLRGVAAVVAAALVGAVTPNVWASVGVFALGAWIAGLRPTSITEVETVSVGP